MSSLGSAAEAVDPDRAGDQEPDVDQLLEEQQDQGPDSLLGFLNSRPSKSVRDVDRADWFDPESGGWDRVALVLEEAAGGNVLPMWGQLLLAGLELLVGYQLIEVPGAFRSSGSEEDAPQDRQELRERLGLSDSEEEDGDREDLPGRP